MDFAKGVNRRYNDIWVAVVRERNLQAPDHSHASDGRVECQKDVMEDDKGEERARLRDPPCLVSMLAIVPVDISDRDGVD